jgi:hypothetical protein
MSGNFLYPESVCAFRLMLSGNNGSEMSRINELDPLELVLEADMKVGHLLKD